MKRCSPSPVIKEMQSKTTMRSHFTFIRLAIIQKWKITGVDEDVEKSGPSHTAGGNIKMLQLLWKTVWQFPKC